jgi:hypothetical protein
MIYILYDVPVRLVWTEYPAALQIMENRLCIFEYHRKSEIRTSNEKPSNKSDTDPQKTLIDTTKSSNWIPLKS